MPHIDLPEDVPGIRAGFVFRPETAARLTQLADVLLQVYNRYVDGLATAVPTDPRACDEMAERIVVHGYAAPH